jgi:hypothetical protein
VDDGAVSCQFAGVSLASMVCENSAYVTQLCVLPDSRGAGLSYEFIRQSMLRFLDLRCDLITLTVTAANTKALGSISPWDSAPPRYLPRSSGKAFSR